MSLVSNDFKKQFENEETESFKLAKVDRIEDGFVYISFYGEDPSQKSYKILSSYKPTIGDVVCVANINDSWIVLGKVSAKYVEEKVEEKIPDHIEKQFNQEKIYVGLEKATDYYSKREYTVIPSSSSSSSYWYVDLGTSKVKYRNIYATNGTIQTSDEREKENINNLDERHLELFLKLLPKAYKMKNGTSGRTHVGFVAQDVEKAMKECGISDLDFAGLIRSPVYKVVDGVETDEIEDYVYGLRYEEFIGILTYVLQDVICFLKGFGYKK